MSDIFGNLTKWLIYKMIDFSSFFIILCYAVIFRPNNVLIRSSSYKQIINIPCHLNHLKIHSVWQRFPGRSLSNDYHSFVCGTITLFTQHWNTPNCTDLSRRFVLLFFCWVFLNQQIRTACRLKDPSLSTSYFPPIYNQAVIIKYIFEKMLFFEYY